MNDVGWWGVVIVLSAVTAWCLYLDARSKY